MLVLGTIIYGIIVIGFLSTVVDEFRRDYGMMKMPTTLKITFGMLVCYPSIVIALRFIDMFHYN